jgi:hypothetical protein
MLYILPHFPTLSVPYCCLLPLLRHLMDLTLQLGYHLTYLIVCCLILIYFLLQHLPALRQIIQVFLNTRNLTPCLLQPQQLLLLGPLHVLLPQALDLTHQL